ncbi:MAG: UPF0147 family protein [archaeon]
MKEEMKKKIEEVTQEMEEVSKDRDVPRNIREKLKEAKKMVNEKESQNLNMSRAIYFMSEASEDINIPFHTRTDLMNITSKLEKINEEIK